MHDGFSFVGLVRAKTCKEHHGTQKHSRLTRSAYVYVCMFMLRGASFTPIHGCGLIKTVEKFNAVCNV